jgi:phosphoribosylaminoimidazolecarboxamide formyltransferase/IMP cyclohydrolase
MTSIRKAYKKPFSRTRFPPESCWKIGGQRLHFSKRTWELSDTNGTLRREGLRYGDNPDQPAAFYSWDPGNWPFGDWVALPRRW